MSIDVYGIQGRVTPELLDGNAVSRARGAVENRNSTESQVNRDTVSLTGQATQLQAVESEIAGLPVVDTQRVVEVQKAMEAGDFRIDPARIADKMLNFEAQMGGQS